MSDAFDRVAKITVGTEPAIPGLPFAPGLSVEKLDCEFNVKRDVSEHPNQCELVIYNLKRENREKIKDAATSELGAIVRVVAGYGTDIGELFLGYCNEVEIYTEGGVDHPLRLSIADGAEKQVEHPKKKHKTVPDKLDCKLARGTPVNLALKTLATLCGVEVAKSTAALPIRMRNGGPVLAYPLHFTGPKFRALAQFLNGTDLQWSVQSNVVEGTLLGLPFEPAGPVLSSTLLSARLTPKGDLTAECLLDHRIRPSTAITVAGLDVKGAFVVDSVEHNGSTAPDGDWTTRLTAVPLL